MRLFAILLSLFVFGTLTASAQSREKIVLTGGPALRFMEHGKGAVSHDVYWFNFVDASVVWLKKLKSEAKPDELVTWLIYRPAYQARSDEMGLDLISQLEGKGKQLGVNLLFFDNTDQLINYFNRGLDRSKVKISSFDYFGHSNKACFLFDYSNIIDTMSIAFLHVNDLKRIHDNVFASDALCKSWGCHSGELYSKKWKSHFDIALTGAIGKTDFSHGALPVLSNSDGKWSQ